jgi:hypothetical protein
MGLLSNWSHQPIHNIISDHIKRITLNSVNIIKKGWLGQNCLGLDVGLDLASTWPQFGLDLASSWSRLGLDLDSTGSRLGLDLASTLVLTLASIGLDLASTWPRLGLDLVSTWSRLGLDWVSTWPRLWSRLGLDLVSTWSRLGLDLVSIWPPSRLILFFGVETSKPSFCVCVTSTNHPMITKTKKTKKISFFISLFLCLSVSLSLCLSVSLHPSVCLSFVYYKKKNE